jgi:ABC-2 type transport system permease protein
MNNLDFKGTGKLLQFYLRHGWIVRAFWLLSPALLVMSAVVSYNPMFATQQELNAFVDESILNPTVAAIHGFILSSDIPGLVAWNVKTVSLIMIGIFNILAVTKIIRGEEESNRADILMSGMVGRQATFAASAIVCLATNVLMGLLNFVTMLAYGLPAMGSLSLSLLFIVGGCLFAAIGTITSQIYIAKRTASSTAIGALGVFYIIAFLSNLGADNSPIGLFTPFRWFFLIRPFDGNHMGYLLIGALATILFVAIALLLANKRDVGEGMIHPKAGRKDALPWFKNEWALGWRQYRISLLTWAIILGAFSLGIGIANTLVSDMLQEQATLASWMEMFGEPDKAFLSLMAFVFTLFVAAYGVLTAGRMHSEEVDGGAELLLCTPMKRIGWMASHALFTIINPIILLAVIGCAITLGSVVSNGSVNFLSTLTTVFYSLPAVLTMSGIVIILFGLLPKKSVALSWSLFSVFVAIQLLWEMGLVPDILAFLTPFGHVYPTNPQTIQTFLILSVVAIAFYAIGFLGFKNRDLQMYKAE